MRCYEGYLEGYGDYDSFLGGVRYSYLRLRKNDNSVQNIPHIVAYPNVEAQIDHLAENADHPDELYVKIYTKGALYIYALDNQGTLYTDYPAISAAWGLAMVKTFGFLVIALLLFLMDQGVGGALFLMLGIITFIWGISGTILLWPSTKAGKLESTTTRRSTANEAA